jgi:hypothetical protein
MAVRAIGTTARPGALAAGFFHRQAPRQGPSSNACAYNQNVLHSKIHAF